MDELDTIEAVAKMVMRLSDQGLRGQQMVEFLSFLTDEQQKRCIMEHGKDALYAGLTDEEYKTLARAIRSANTTGRPEETTEIDEQG